MPELPGRGVDLADGTWSASMPMGADTPLVMRSSSPCGCVTVILVGGRVSGVVASASGRLRELVRTGGAAAAGGLGGVRAICLTDFSSSPRASSWLPLLVRRVAIEGGVVLVLLGGAVLVLLGGASSGARRIGWKLRRVWRSPLPVAEGTRGRTTLAMILLEIRRVGCYHLLCIATLDGHCMRAGRGQGKTRRLGGG